MNGQGRVDGGATRRRFLGEMIGSLAGAAGATAVLAAEAPVSASGAGRLAFAADGNGFRFDTGSLRGVLRADGKSLGLRPVVDSNSGATISGAYGLLSHYRLLDAETRYGSAAWDWASTARLLPDGTVEAVWASDEQHPFELRAAYRWTAANTLELTTSLTARKELKRMEVFLASYFAGFPKSQVYTQGTPATGGRPVFFEATKANGMWQMFPRDDESTEIIHDGRWKRPPNPVDWTIMPRLAAPVAIRRDETTGLAAVIAARREDCFAVATPFGEEGHRSVYFSLFGRDFRAGETASARTRVLIARGITDEQAASL